MTNMEQRYFDFLNDIRAAAANGTPVVPSKMTAKHKLIHQAFSVLVDTGYVKVMGTNKRKHTIVWIPTTDIKLSDVTKVYTECKKIQAAIKRNNVAKTAKVIATKATETINTKTGTDAVHTRSLVSNSKSAKITISGVTVTVPVINNVISLEIQNSKISVEL